MAPCPSHGWFGLTFGERVIYVKTERQSRMSRARRREVLRGLWHLAVLVLTVAVLWAVVVAVAWLVIT